MCGLESIWDFMNGNLDRTGHINGLTGVTYVTVVVKPVRALVWSTEVQNHRDTSGSVGIRTASHTNARVSERPSRQRRPRRADTRGSGGSSPRCWCTALRQPVLTELSKVMQPVRPAFVNRCVCACARVSSGQEANVTQPKLFSFSAMLQTAVPQTRCRASPRGLFI